MVFEKLKFTTVSVEMKIEKELLELAMPTLISLPFSAMRWFKTTDKQKTILMLTIEGSDKSIEAALGTVTFLHGSHSHLYLDIKQATGTV